jgi:NAD(P)-dependent dehydrogenase (short-subunit alcohol dehydrogenase family)
MTRAPIALVTGARRGIGRAIALALAADGFDLVLADLVRDEAAEATLREVAQRGREAVFHVADIADLAGHGPLIDRAYVTFGTLDCLVNNAGVQVHKRGDLLDVTPESFDRLIGVNLRGTFFLTQAVARRMVAETREPRDPHRSIVTISSANAWAASPDRPEYCFSKASLAVMTRLFALRLGPHGIATYDVQPGVIRTDMTAAAKEKYDRLISEGLTPIARWGEAEDIGRAVATLACGRMPFSTGDSFRLDGGLHIHRL